MRQLSQVAFAEVWVMLKIDLANGATSIGLIVDNYKAAKNEAEMQNSYKNGWHHYVVGPHIVWKS